MLAQLLDDDRPPASIREQLETIEQCLAMLETIVTAETTPVWVNLGDADSKASATMLSGPSAVPANFRPVAGLGATDRFGCRVQVAREARGWSCAQLAEAVGITSEAVRLIEKTERVKPANRVKLIIELGLKPPGAVATTVDADQQPSSEAALACGAAMSKSDKNPDDPLEVSETTPGPRTLRDALRRHRQTAATDGQILICPIPLC